MRNPGGPLLIALAVATAGATLTGAASPAAGADPFQQSEAGQCKPLPVRSVEHISIEPGAAPKLVATGTVPSAGWQKPELRFRSIAKFRSRDATAIYAFVACPPETAAKAVTPVTAETLYNLAPQLGRVYHLVVEAATNSMTLDPPAPQH